MPGIDITLDGAVAVVRVDKPDRRNMIDSPMALALADFFEAATMDRSVRAVLITGSGRDFCTGGDPSGGPSVEDLVTIDYRHLSELYRRLFRNLWEVEKPVVSAVNGTVAGAGWMLALLADLVVADRDARWTHVFTRRGMVPHAGDPYYLPRIIGFHRLNELALLSDPVTSAELHSWGVVNRSVGADEVFPTAMELAQRLAAGPTRTQGMTKRLYRRSFDIPMEATFENERNATALLTTTEDRHEGVAALVEGRPPRFTGS